MATVVFREEDEHNYDMLHKQGYGLRCSDCNPGPCRKLALSCNGHDKISDRVLNSGLCDMLWMKSDCDSMACHDEGHLLHVGMTDHPSGGACCDGEATDVL